MTLEADKRIAVAAEINYCFGISAPIGSRDRANFEQKKESFIAGAKSDAAKNYWQKGMYTEEEVDALKSEIVDLKQYIYSKEIDSRNERERDVEFLKEIKDNLSKYLNRQDVTKGDYAMQMIEDWIRELNKNKKKEE